MCPCVEAVQPYHAILGALPVQMLILLSSISVDLIHLQSQRCVYSITKASRWAWLKVIHARSEFRGSGGQSGENVCKQGQIGGDNDLLGHVPGGNWGMVGSTPPLVRIFGGLERKLRCAQDRVFYTFFCLPVSRDFAKNVEIHFFTMLTSQKLRDLH